MSKNTQHKERAVAQEESGRARLERLALESRTQVVSDSARQRVLAEWDRATRVVGQARQMLRDALVTQAQCAEDVVRKLGRGDLRYKGVLYSPSSNRNRIYLRKLVRKPHV